MPKSFTISILILLFCRSFSFSSDYVTSIKDLKQFKNLSGEPLTLKYGNVQAVKIVYDLNRKKLFYANSKIYKYHLDFCSNVLGDNFDVFTFNAINYKENERRDYVLGTINYYSSLNIYTVEFATFELFSKDDILLFNKVKESFFAPNKLYLFPATNEQIKGFNLVNDGSVRRITADVIYKGISYQPIIKETTYGYLRMVESDSIKNVILDSHDILVVNGSPNTLPITAGVITTSFQPPLSHINVLCANRNTPIMAYKNAWHNKSIAALKDSLVKLSILQDTFYLSKANLNEAKKHWKRTRKKYVLKLGMNSTKKILYDVEKLNYQSTSYVGAKASNIGELTKVKLPKDAHCSFPKKSFAIPFIFYLEHIKKSEAYEKILALNNYDSITDSKELKKHLKAIRKAINNTPIDTFLLRLVESKIISNNVGNSYRFRSSTNAEDIQGFNGAGLYDSKTGILNDSIKTVEKAIKKVWASLWNDRAFMERKYFNIKNETVAMGVMVNPAYGDELINGVAITKNLYRPEVNAYILNMQKGEVPVVNPPEGVTVEQTILFDEWEYNNRNILTDYISYSSLNKMKPLLNEDELLNLKAVLRAIKNHYYNNLLIAKESNFNNFALDIEFKYTKSRKLVIKQVRVYDN